MATFQTPLYTSQVGAAGKSLNVGTLLERDVQGKERVMISSYTSIGTEATNDLIQLGLLPIGAKVLTVGSYVITSPTGAIGTTVTGSIGDQTTAARWMAATAMAAGGVFLFQTTLGSELLPVAIVGTTAAADNIVTLKLTSITSFTAAKVVTVVLRFVIQ